MMWGARSGNDKSAVILNFAVPKVALSAVIVILVAVQPVAAFLSGMDAPFLANLAMFGKSPSLFVVVVSCCWLIGVAGLLKVARSGVKRTKSGGNLVSSMVFGL
ncbi:hypothetical protein PRIC2_000868 [Phytophthora ramorum]